ncbi:hypothetical protein [Mycobacterium sp. MS1601]|uniref:hypothetical protein n=1 Tax=Mycobacterium sp. MS1601 TaxID=1936029 RepID=UPI0009FA9216|nr:hypothetical protein [Mycobacterium sp. MS1601]
MTESVHLAYLTVDERHVFAALADELIPRAQGMPSASEAEVPTVWLDVALHARPDLIGPLREAIARAGTTAPRDSLEKLNSAHGQLFDALTTATAGAYLLNPDVRRLIGYPGQVPHPLTDDTAEYFDLLEKVVERGEIYRHASG